MSKKKNEKAQINSERAYMVLGVMYCSSMNEKLPYAAALRPSMTFIGTIPV